METLKALFQHLEWANQLILETLLTEKENKEAIHLFSHLLVAEQIWLARMEGRDWTGYSLWGEADLEKCRKLVEENKREFSLCLEELSEKELKEVITYSNSKGKKFHSTKRDILLHVAMHGQYHRGQINKKLRESEATPVNVDYITYTR